MRNCHSIRSARDAFCRRRALRRRSPRRRKPPARLRAVPFEGCRRTGRVQPRARAPVGAEHVVRTGGRCTASVRRSPGDAAAPTKRSRVRPCRRARSRARRADTPGALRAGRFRWFLSVGGAFVYQATDRSARVMAAELTRRSPEVLGLERHARHPPGRQRGRELDDVRLRLAHAAAGGFRRAPNSSWSVRDRACTAKARSPTSCTATRDGPCRCSCSRKAPGPRSSSKCSAMKPRSGAPATGRSCSFAREPRQDVERLASFVQASLRWTVSGDPDRHRISTRSPRMNIRWAIATVGRAGVGVADAERGCRSGRLVRLRRRGAGQRRRPARRTPSRPT